MLAFSVLDSVCRKLKECQTEIISEDFYMKRDTNKFNSREQPSYWKEAHGVGDVEYQVEKPNFIKIDKYWLKVFTCYYSLKNHFSSAARIKELKLSVYL